MNALKDAAERRAGSLGPPLMSSSDFDIAFLTPVFDPDALGPHCGTVTLVLYSEKEPEKGDTRLLDPNVLQRIWQDFAPYRAPAEAALGESTVWRTS